MTNKSRNENERHGGRSFICGGPAMGEERAAGPVCHSVTSMVHIPQMRLKTQLPFLASLCEAKPASIHAQLVWRS